MKYDENLKIDEFLNGKIAVYALFTSLHKEANWKSQIPLNLLFQKKTWGYYLIVLLRANVIGSI